VNGAVYLADVLLRLHKYKAMAERAMAQVDDAGFFSTPSAEVNSIAVTVKHIAGNMRSRWTDFLTTDGEKPDRERDTEFEIDDEDTRESLIRRWEAGWLCAFEAIEPLTDEDLVRVVRIRDEPHSVLAAVQRQLMHYAYHVGQVVHRAKELAGGKWMTLSVPRGQSDRFHAERRRESTDDPA
jgi:hypothetical protein